MKHLLPPLASCLSERVEIIRRNFPQTTVNITTSSHQPASVLIHSIFVPVTMKSVLPAETFAVNSNPAHQLQNIHLTILFFLFYIFPHPPTPDLSHKHSLLMFAAAAAKLLQSCPTLCDPIDGSPTGSPIPGILQARTGVGCLPFPSPMHESEK